MEIFLDFFFNVFQSSACVFFFSPRRLIAAPPTGAGIMAPAQTSLGRAFENSKASIHPVVLTFFFPDSKQPRHAPSRAEALNPSTVLLPDR